MEKDVELPHAEEEEQAWLYEGKEFYDDLTGEHFDKDRAIDVRKLEMHLFRKHNEGLQQSPT